MPHRGRTAHFVVSFVAFRDLPNLPSPGSGLAKFGHGICIVLRIRSQGLDSFSGGGTSRIDRSMGRGAGR